MASTISRLFMSLALQSIVVSATAVAQAQPKLEMHRAGVTADDGSGWHLAVSSKGSFSIRLPIPFNDFTILDPSTGETTYAVGGKSSEGIKFSAAELPATGKRPKDIATILESFSSNPANKVSDVSRNTGNDADVLSFSVANATSIAHIRYVQTKHALYTLTIECPSAYRDLVAANKDKFFESFQLKTKS
jgi:hypothetical protein